MRFIIAFLFFFELCFLGFQFGSAHFGLEYDFIPSPGLTETAKPEQKNEKTSKKSAKSAKKEDSVSTTRQTNLKTVQLNYQETFIKLNPKYGIFWFGNVFNISSPTRLIICSPLVLFPLWLLFFSLQKLFSPASSESRFATFVKKGQVDKALALWKAGTVRHHFKQMPIGLQKKWFRQLADKDEKENALEWGSMLYHQNTSDRSFAREFGVFLLEKCQLVDLKYANLFHEILTAKKDAKLAEIIARKGLLKYQDAEIETDVFKLAQLVQSIAPLPEVAKMLAERQMTT